jgi:hypothetical protein
MAGSTLDPDQLPFARKRKTLRLRAIGPSDSSDTGSDRAGPGVLGDTSDRNGTGERMTADNDPNVRADADIGTDRVVGPDEAGLGYGPDDPDEDDRGLH